jgi:hypothetical protein
MSNLRDLLAFHPCWHSHQSKSSRRFLKYIFRYSSRLALQSDLTPVAANRAGLQMLRQVLPVLRPQRSCLIIVNMFTQRIPSGTNHSSVP